MSGLHNRMLRKAHSDPPQAVPSYIGVNSLAYQLALPYPALQNSSLTAPLLVPAPANLTTPAPSTAPLTPPVGATGPAASPNLPAAASAAAAPALAKQVMPAPATEGLSWLPFENTHGAEWELSGVPSAPYSLRLTDSFGRVLILKWVEMPLMLSLILSVIPLLLQPVAKCLGMPCICLQMASLSALLCALGA